MESELTTVATAAPGRLIGLAPDGALRLVWGDAAIRLPAYDLPHLGAVIDAWCADEEPPGLRRGYYRLCHGPDGGVQLWLNGVGLLLSREDLRVLGALVEAAASELLTPFCRQRRAPLGLGYRPLRAPAAGQDRQN